MRVVVEAQLERPCCQSCLEDWASPRHLTSSLSGRTADSQNTVQTLSCRRSLGVDECQTIPCFLPIGAIESALRSTQATTASCCIGDLISSIMTMTQLLTFQTVMFKHSDWTAPEWITTCQLLAIIKRFSTTEISLELSDTPATWTSLAHSDRQNLLITNHLAAIIHNAFQTTTITLTTRQDFHSSQQRLIL